MNKKIFKKIIILTVIAFFGLSFANTALGITQKKVEVTSSFFGVTGDICQLWKAIFEFSLQIAGGLSVLVISIGGIYYILSLGQTEKIKRAKDIIWGALFGYFLILISYGIFLLVAPRALQCKIEVPELRICVGLNCVFDDCEKHGVDRCFAMAMAKMESGFTPDLNTSWHKYKGLFQISAERIDQYNKKFGTNYTKDDLFNGEINGEVACWAYGNSYGVVPGIDNIIGDDERKKYAIKRLAAHSGNGALQWIIRKAKEKYNTTNPTQQQLYDTWENDWGEEWMKRKYRYKCGSKEAVPGCCRTWRGDGGYYTMCNEEDFKTEGARYGKVLRSGGDRVMRWYDLCKEGKEDQVYQPK